MTEREKWKILVVDDEPHIVKLISARLQANNYEVIAAYNGEECLKKAREEEPDLIILDIMMPKMDGYSTLIAMREMRQIEGNIKKIPVIVLSARADHRVRELVEKEEIEGYILKPFRADELLRKIKEVLDKEENQDEKGGKS